MFVYGGGGKGWANILNLSAARFLQTDMRWKGFSSPSPHLLQIAEDTGIISSPSSLSSTGRFAMYLPRSLLSMIAWCLFMKQWPVTNCVIWEQMTFGSLIMSKEKPGLGPSGNQSLVWEHPGSILHIFFHMLLAAVSTSW